MEEDNLSSVGKKGRTVTQEEKELLYSRVEELKRSNAALLAENDMMKTFIVSFVPVGTRGNGSGQQLEGEGVGWKRKPRVHTSDQPQLLTIEQKIYLADKILGKTRYDMEALRERSERISNNCKATMEEAELRQADIKRSKNDFERRMQQIVNDCKLVMHHPEKVVKCIEDKFKVNYIKKLDLENQTLEAQKRKLRKELKHVQQRNDNQMKDLSSDDKPPAISRTVEELKTFCLKTKHNLDSCREQLHSMTMKSTQLDKDITKKKQMLAKIEEEIQHTEEEYAKAETLNRRLRRQLADCQAPDVTEYMHVKAKHKSLLQSVKMWERKVEIAEMVLKTHTSGQNKQRATVTPANSVETGPRFGGQVPVKFPDIAEHQK